MLLHVCDHIFRYIILARNALNVTVPYLSRPLTNYIDDIKENRKGKNTQLMVF